MSPLAQLQAPSSVQPSPILGTPVKAQCWAQSPVLLSEASQTPSALPKPIASKTRQTLELTTRKPRRSSGERLIIGAR
jgi:hypothetical protein